MAQIGQFKLRHSDGIKYLIPVYEESDNPSCPLRVGTSSGVGILPLADPSEANTAIRINTPSGIKGVHRPISTTQNFSYNGKSVQTWTAPDTLIGPVTIEVSGAGGSGAMSEDGSSAGNGRPGGKIVADVQVSPGETLYLYVSQGGRRESYSSNGSGGWGAHGGGNGSYGGEGRGGNGGGSSEVRIATNSDSAAVLSAGGGQGGTNPYSGGGGGGHAGEGGGGSGTGLVVDPGPVLSSTITAGGGASGGSGATNNYASDAGQNGWINLSYTA